MRPSEGHVAGSIPAGRTRARAAARTVGSRESWRPRPGGPVSDRRHTLPLAAARPGCRPGARMQRQVPRSRDPAGPPRPRRQARCRRGAGQGRRRAEHRRRHQPRAVGPGVARAGPRRRRASGSRSTAASTCWRRRAWRCSVRATSGSWSALLAVVPIGLDVGFDCAANALGRFFGTPAAGGRSAGAPAGRHNSAVGLKTGLQPPVAGKDCPPRVCQRTDSAIGGVYLRALATSALRGPWPASLHTRRTLS